MEICLGEIVATEKDFFKLAKRELQRYHRVELWVDHLSDFSPAVLAKAVKLFGDRLIVLFRRRDQAEYNLPLIMRKELISKVSPSHLDLDWKTQKGELQYWNKLKKDQNLSCHGMNTKSFRLKKKFKKFFNEAKKLKPEIVKIAFRTDQPKEAKRVIEIYSERKKQFKGKLITMGMGKEALPTRVFQILSKQPLVYAPRNKKKVVAPGQLTFAEVKKLEKVFKNKGLI